MHFYEINMLISPNLSHEEAISFISKIENELQDLGKIISETKAERKKLAYTIEKEEEAWLSFFSFFPNQEKDLKESLDLIEKKLKEEKNILRHLIIKKEEQKAIKKTRSAPEHIATKEIKKEEPAPKQEVELKDVEEKINELLEE
ncbi:MAG: 30S ribosomal protein S6 [Candidatus Pacebacteria bacterium]|nr:30S ribosomal protein S6 [Candidatus Paceibacterota bacterium]